jgi:hypothetical protein
MISRVSVDMSVSLGRINPRLLPTVIALSYRLFAHSTDLSPSVIYYFRLQDRSDRDLTVVLGGLHGSEQYGPSQAGT